MIERPSALQALRTALANNPVSVLLGPRQCGKTTLARRLAEETTATWFDLERPADRAKLESAELVLGGLSGLVVIDEVQRLPELFTVLRPLADRPRVKTKFLLLGSASPDLVKGVSESLAGRAGFVDPGGFELADLGAAKQNRLWLRGGLPRSFLARDEKASLEWRQDFIRTFLERGMPQPGIRISLGSAVAVLDDAGPLPRANLERSGTGAGAWVVGKDRARLSGPVDRRVCAAAITAVV